MVDNVFILAGGSGTRLWPASLNEYPKQFIKIKGEKSLLALTIERALALDIPGEIIIITLKSQVEDVIKECAPYANTGKIVILPEPVARNTATAIAAAAWWVAAGMSHPAQDKKQGAASSALILPADHLIEGMDVFKKNAEEADLLAREGFLVTFGIPPLYPETGYGYIKRGEPHGKGFKVESFMEKPNIKTAKQFMEDGNYFWNSGMFVFKMDAFLTEIEKYSPDIAASFAKLDKTPGPFFEGNFKIIMDSPEVEEAYKQSPSISIDYAVMEKTPLSAMILAEFSWNDIGSWDQFETIIKNFKWAELFEVGSSNNTVFSDIPVALCGVEDLIVVIKNGKALVCKKGASQKVKELRSIIEDHERTDLL
ncbi:MAG: mannose-1-phosphate guanylyltransferase [Spirochaetaceae bacterium]|nr:mannose-1-phosphate guanylyltransferase [Spirochaetaceae bacterium]